MSKLNIGILVNGVDVKRIDAFGMQKLFEMCGYSGQFFDKVKYLGIKNDNVIFKYINHGEEWYVGRILLNLKNGEVDFECGVCDDFLLEHLVDAEEEYKKITEA